MTLTIGEIMRKQLESIQEIASVQEGSKENEGQEREFTSSS